MTRKRCEFEINGDCYTGIEMAIALRTIVDALSNDEDTQDRIFEETTKFDKDIVERLFHRKY